MGLVGKLEVSSKLPLVARTVENSFSRICFTRMQQHKILVTKHAAVADEEMPLE